MYKGRRSVSYSIYAMQFCKLNPRSPNWMRGHQIPETSQSHTCQVRVARSLWTTKLGYLATTHLQPVQGVTVAVAAG